MSNLGKDRGRLIKWVGGGGGGGDASKQQHKLFIDIKS